MAWLDIFGIEDCDVTFGVDAYCYCDFFFFAVFVLDGYCGCGFIDTFEVFEGADIDFGSGFHFGGADGVVGCWGAALSGYYAVLLGFFVNGNRCKALNQ